MARTIMTHTRHCVRGTLAACATVLLAAAPWVAASSAAAAAVPAAAGHGLKKVHDPGRVTGTIHGHCSYRDHGHLPDPRCTPGSIDPHVTQADIRSTICKKGWTKTVRPPESQTETFKFHVAYPHYGTPRADKSELDHLVPLELGGSNDATNLWPEVGRPSGNPKDKVEDALNAAVCQGRASLIAAQDAIAADWLTAEKKLSLGGGGSSARAWCTASASYNAAYRDYDVYVHSNQPDQTVTATASNGASHSYRTDSSGYADVYLHAASGDTVKVTAGAASCSTAA
jgi:hypothetical protein